MTTPQDIHSGFNLSLDQGIAEKLGMEAALIFNHILYWLRINANKPDVEMIDGKYWMYETNKQMAEFFGFLSEDQINRAINKLKDAGMIEAKPLSKNKFDRTLSYTVYDQGKIKKNSPIPRQRGMHNHKPAESDSAPARNVYNDTTEEPCIKQQQKQQPAAVSRSLHTQVSVEASQKEKPVSEKEVVDEKKQKAFNWFMQIGCDEITALDLIETYSHEDLKSASLYVIAQIERKKKTNETIDKPVAYLRKTLEGKWWKLPRK